MSLPDCGGDPGVSHWHGRRERKEVKVKVKEKEEEEGRCSRALCELSPSDSLAPCRRHGEACTVKVARAWKEGKHVGISTARK